MALYSVFTNIELTKKIIANEDKIEQLFDKVSSSDWGDGIIFIIDTSVKSFFLWRNNIQDIGEIALYDHGFEFVKPLKAMRTI